MEHGSESVNELPLREPEQARVKLLERLESDEPVVDVDTSDAYEFSEVVREQLAE